MSLFARGRHLPLLLALSALFLLYPLMVELGHLRFFRFVFVMVLVFAGYSLGGEKKHLWIAVALGGPAAIGQLVAFAAPGGKAPVVATVLALLFMAYTTAVVMRSVLEPGRVTGDKIAGAISAYLLLGLLWAIAGGLLELLVPGSFNSPAAIDLDSGAAAEYAFIYYSFTTLTTLGYGDITPANPWSETLAWTEAVVGQLFIAILIARLVGLHIYHSTTEED